MAFGHVRRCLLLFHTSLIVIKGVRQCSRAAQTSLTTRRQRDGMHTTYAYIPNMENPQHCVRHHPCMCYCTTAAAPQCLSGADKEACLLRDI